MPVTFFIAFYVIFVHVRGIEKQLYPPLLDENGEHIKPELLGFNFQHDSIDAFAFYDAIP